MLEFSVRTHRGRVREKNQDCYFVPSNGPIHLFAVADGMGGHAAGEVASSLSIQAIQDQIVPVRHARENFDPPRLEEFLHTAFLDANERILQAQKENTELEGMGTTLTVAAVLKGELLVGHVGDSQAHLFRDGEHQQITEDHSLVMELWKNGEIKQDELRTHPQRHMLTRALGTPSPPQVDFYHVALQSDDMVLLCTDGLTSMLPLEPLREIIYSAEALEDKVQTLVTKANDQGGLDNITVLLIRVLQ